MVLITDFNAFGRHKQHARFKCYILNRLEMITNKSHEPFSLIYILGQTVSGFTTRPQYQPAYQFVSTLPNFAVDEFSKSYVFIWSLCTGISLASPKSSRPQSVTPFVILWVNIIYHNYHILL